MRLKGKHISILIPSTDFLQKTFLAFRGRADISYQLSLFRWQRRRLYGLVDWVGAAERVVEAVHFLEAFVSLLVDALALRHLIEHRRLWLGIVLHKLHVLEDCKTETDEVE